MSVNKYSSEATSPARPAPKPGQSSNLSRPLRQQIETNYGREYLLEKFGSYKNYYESSFSRALAKHGDFNLYTLLLAIFCFYVIVVHETVTGTFNITNPYRPHCHVTESIYENSSCSTRFYYNYNNPNKVRIRHDLSFIPRVTVTKCSHCNTTKSKTKHNEQKDFQFMCEEMSYKNYVDILKYGSEALFALPVGIMGDIYGRRKVFVLSAILNILANLLIFADSIWVVYIAQIIKGIACENMVYSSYIIFSERCNKFMRRNGILVFVGRGFSLIILYELLAVVRRWQIDHAASYSMFYGVVFIMWYIEESPRWMFFTGRTEIAWKKIGEAPPSDTQITNIALYKPTLKEHFTLFTKPFFRTRIALTFALFFLSTTIQLTTFVILHELTFGALQFVLITGICDILTTIITLVLFIVTTRKNSLCIFFGFITLANLVLFAQDAESTSDVVYAAALIIHKCLSPGAVIILMYQTLEQYPTKHRYTALGVANVAIKMSTFLTSFTQDYLRPHQQSVTYTPMLMFSVTAVLLICFLHETSNADLPDVEREALSTKLI